MYDKIKDIYKNLGDEEFVPLIEGIDSSLLGLFEINKKGQIKRISDGRILKVTPREKNDYPAVKLVNKDGKRRFYKIHILLAVTFIENPEPGTHPEVDHVDRNPKNYKLENLRWVTRSENKKNRSMSTTAFKKYEWWVSPDRKTCRKENPNDPSWDHYYTNEPDLFEKYDFPEDWKLIPDSKGSYCSSSGLILFTARTKYVTTGHTNFAGYKTVNISGKQFRVHRLVYQLFSGDTESLEGLEIDHKDTVRGNNNISNLLKVTPKDNRNNPLTRKHLSKAICCFDLKGNLIKEYQSCKEAYIDLGGLNENTNSNISRCCKGKQKTYMGYIWKYKDDENNTNL